MASFTSLIKSGKIKTAYLHKQAVLEDINTHVQIITELDKDSPSERVFSRMERDADTTIHDLKVAIRELSKLLYEQNPEISTDTDFLSDQKNNRGEMLCLFHVIDEHIKVLNVKGIKYPPDIEPTMVPTDIGIMVQKSIETLISAQEIRQIKI